MYTEASKLCGTISCCHPLQKRTSGYHPPPFSASSSPNVHYAPVCLDSKLTIASRILSASSTLKGASSSPEREEAE